VKSIPFSVALNFFILIHGILLALYLLEILVLIELISDFANMFWSPLGFAFSVATGLISYLLKKFLCKIGNLRYIVASFKQGG